MKYVTGLIRILLVALTLQIGATVAAAANENVMHLSVRDVADLLKRNGEARVLDVRLGFEYDNGHIDGAERINYFSPYFRRDVSTLDRDATWVVHCKSGHRSSRAIRIMAELGFNRIVHMDGGFDAWREAGLPVAQ